MHIAILGAGNVGGTLGEALADAGHTIVWGTRHPEEVDRSGGRAAPVAEAVAGAEIVVLAVPASAVDAALESAGDLSGKVIIDATNPVRWDDGPVHAPPAEGSMAQHVAAVTGVPVVKAFNTFGA